MRLVVGLMFMLIMQVALANSTASSWFDFDIAGKLRLRVDLFLSSKCPHCHKADVFFKKIEKKVSWLNVHRYVINEDKLALDAFYHHLQKSTLKNFAVPSVFFCDSQWIGFEGEKTTGKELTKAFFYCYQRITQQGKLTGATIHVLQKWGGASLVHLDQGIVKSDKMIVFLSAMSDAFLVCSFFCFAAFLAFMWMYFAKKWDQFRVGVMFLGSLFMTHYIQQVHSAFYYQLTFKLTWVAILIGLLLLFFVRKEGDQKKNPLERRPDFMTFIVIFFTAFIVQTYQQNCPLNFSLVFEQWLTAQNFSGWVRFFYHLLYQLIYIFPMGLLVLLCLFLGRHRRLIVFYPALNIAARLILVAIGIILLAYPALMANLWLSLVVLLGSVFMGWLIERCYGQNH